MSIKDLLLKAKFFNHYVNNFISALYNIFQAVFFGLMVNNFTLFCTISFRQYFLALWLGQDFGDLPVTSMEEKR